MGVGILRHFNFGVLIKADLRDLRCICGKKLGNDAAICAACGLVTFKKNFRLLVHSNVINAGKNRETAHTIRTFYLKTRATSQSEASYSKIFRILERLISNVGKA